MLWGYDHKAIGWLGCPLVDLIAPVRPGQLLALVDLLCTEICNDAHGKRRRNLSFLVLLLRL